MLAVGSRTLHLAVFAGALLIVLFGLAWVSRNRDRRAATEFAAFLCIVGLWVGTAIVEVFAGPEGAYYASLAGQGLRPVMSVAWFYFALTYAGYEDVLRSTWMAALAAVALLYSLAFSAVPPLATTYAYDSVETVSTPLVAVALEGETVHFHLTEIIGYLFVLVGSVGLVQRLVRAVYVEQWQTLAIGGSVVVVVLLDIFPDLIVGTVPGIDYAAAGVACSTLLFIVALYRDDLSRHVPVARMHVVESLADPVVVLNPDHDIVDYNPAATEILAVSEPIGTNATAAMPCDCTREQIEAAIAAGEATITLRDGPTETVYDVSVTRVTDGGVEAGIAFVFSDVTELRQRTRDLQRQSEQLDEFAGIVSHDLRNPLMVARGNLELLDDDQSAPIADALDRMDEIIEDALVLAREGRALGRRQWTDLRPVAADAWRSSRTGEAELRNEIPEEVRVSTDRSRLVTVFENLFRNSIDHGPDDVTVSAGTIGESGFYVEDTGPGVPADAAAEIFEKGYTTGGEGSGLGLAIVQSIVDAHGWEIRVVDGETGGARFEITGVNLREPADGE
ncbi:ATP-binding protein [Haloarcula litorea]|uniref:ATP-binding protein n=1 Tax=Haloarcula litorea TaxID=3032579 RepID=UPI0023E8AC6D|nr:ATP-binding protein [Halomicroarcula sp. GDY20]